LQIKKQEILKLVCLTHSSKIIYALKNGGNVSKIQYGFEEYE
jgi:hypothetical protein